MGIEDVKEGQQNMNHELRVIDDIVEDKNIQSFRLKEFGSQFGNVDTIQINEERKKLANQLLIDLQNKKLKNMKSNNTI